MSSSPTSRWTARPGYPRPHLPHRAGVGADRRRAPAGLVLPRRSTTRSAATTSGPTSTRVPTDEIAAFLHDPAVDALHLRARRLAARLLRARRPRARALRPRLLRAGAARRSAAASAPSCCRPPCTWPGTGRAPGSVTVNTNSLDHPRALPLYQKAGFAPVRRETAQPGADPRPRHRSTPDRGDAMFETLKPTPPDKIIELIGLFKADPRDRQARPRRRRLQGRRGPHAR